jgi:hypothetical protein
MNTDRKNPAETQPAQGETQDAVNRAPHERDESASSQAQDDPTQGRVGQAAKQDAESGRVDTTKGRELDQTYQKQREGTPDPQRRFAP